MSLSLYWMHCGGCGGDAMALLNLESPGVTELFDSLDISVLWLPSHSNAGPKSRQRLLDELLSGDRKLDILCIEGAVIRGPSGTGMYHTCLGQPSKDIVSGLADRAEHILAVGTCASFGGISRSCGIEATGLQFEADQPGGFLGADFCASSGAPVINLPGCPCHPSILVGTLASLASGAELELNHYNMPLDWYNVLVHQGCTRNEYHEYRVEDNQFGEKGCMFFHLGCQGPLAYGACNKLLWNGRSSKTRVGVPCFGCTSPDFPHDWPFFETPNIEGIPENLPDGVDRAHYMAYKEMAAAAAPIRLTERKTGV